MKSRSIERGTAAIALLGILVLASAANGGVVQSAQDAAGEKVVGAPERQRPVGEKELPRPHTSVSPGAAESAVKCWQNGRLIFEERNWRASTGPLPGTAMVSGSNGGGRLQLMPFGETFCFYKQASQ